MAVEEGLGRCRTVLTGARRCFCDSPGSIPGRVICATSPLRARGSSFVVGVVEVDLGFADGGTRIPADREKDERDRGADDRIGDLDAEGDDDRAGDHSQGDEAGDAGVLSTTGRLCRHADTLSSPIVTARPRF